MENDVYGTCIGVEYKHELKLKQKMHKGSISNSEKYMTPKQETKIQEKYYKK